MIKLLKVFLFVIFSLLCLLSENIYSQTQTEMNIKESKEYKKTDDELNNTYKEILEIYRDDTLFIHKLKIAQRAWLVFRDAYIKSLYPHELNYYGSDISFCYSNALTEITKERLNELSQWIIGSEEGDVCSGSVKAKDSIKKVKNN